jgi:hypothetical protein
MDGEIWLKLLLHLAISIAIAYVWVQIRGKFLGKTSTSDTVLITIICTLIPLIGIIPIIYYGIKLMFKKRTLLETIKNVSDTAQERVHEYRVQKIAEDEAIRATVKKSMENSDDTSELQELINKAVAKGDTETAQALLEILN